MTLLPPDLGLTTAPHTHDPGGARMLKLPEGTKADAVFTGPNQEYRVMLSRVWDEANKTRLLAGMMNPSTAGHEWDDPTVAKIGRLARRLGYGGLLVGNACAYRATDKMRLLQVDDPVGPENHEWLRSMAHRADLILIGHGILPKGLQLHARAMCDILAGSGKPLHVLRLLKDGTPAHPLYLPDALDPVVWSRA